MLSDEGIRELSDAIARVASMTSIDNLRRLAAITGAAHDKEPVGDNRTELGIMHEIYVAELNKRGG